MRKAHMPLKKKKKKHNKNWSQAAWVWIPALPFISWGISSKWFRFVSVRLIWTVLIFSLANKPLFAAAALTLLPRYVHWYRSNLCFVTKWNFRPRFFLVKWPRTFLNSWGYLFFFSFLGNVALELALPPKDEDSLLLPITTTFNEHLVFAMSFIKLLQALCL